MTDPQTELFDLHIHPLSGGDAAGKVFISGDRIFRGVAVEAMSDTLYLFDQGIIVDLIKRHLIPRTWVSDTRIEGFPLVLEQELLPCITYSYEWTFSMLRNAGELILKLREVLNRYGYDLKDAHPDNITFNGALPLWMDIGSLIKTNDTGKWIAEKRFTQSFIYPLQIWSRYGEQIGRRIIVGNDYLPVYAAFIVLHPWVRFSGIRNLKKISRLIDIYMGLYGIPDVEFKKKVSRVSWLDDLFKSYPPFEKFFHGFFANKKLPFRRTSISSLRHQLHGIKKPKIASKWKEYHSNVLLEIGSPEKYPRFKKVIDILEEFEPDSITEIGANQGLLSKLILKRINPQRLIAIDIDGDALDIFYQNNRKAKANVFHAVFDVARPIIQLPKIFPDKRLCSEAVVALAVSHHMIIAQCNSAEYALKCLASFGKKWIVIEYMPYGLNAKPVEEPPPSSYSRENFESAFSLVADIVGIFEVEPTRILYVGRKKPDGQECLGNNLK